jgi:hypothetical protein
MIDDVSSRVVDSIQACQNSRARITTLASLRELAGYRDLVAPVQSSLCQCGTVGLCPHVGQCVEEWLLRVGRSYKSLCVYVTILWNGGWSCFMSFMSL